MSTTQTAPVAALRRGSQARRREARHGWTFIAPFLIVFTITFLIPIGMSVYKSFFRQQSEGGLYGGGGLVDTFVGFLNFEYVLGSQVFWQGIGRVFTFGIIQVPIMILGALGLALLLDSVVVRRPGPFRLSYFLPFAIPGVVASIIWLYMYSPSMSPINKGIMALGLEPIGFFDPNLILLSMANMTTWTFTGYNMLIFLAALQAIPGELYEAARIDGASGWDIIRKIKVPMVRSAALLAVLLSIIGTVQLFNEPTVMATANTWMGNAYMPMQMAYNTMMGGISPSGDGPASAISIVMALIAGSLAVIYSLLQRRAG